MCPEQPVLYSADFTACAALGPLDAAAIGDAFSAALLEAGATIVGEARHAFAGGGLTCVLILQESHAVVHTWPETATVNVDIFSCSSRLKSLAAIDTLAQLFGAGQVSVREILRADGHLYTAAQQRA